MRLSVDALIELSQSQRTQILRNLETVKLPSEFEPFVTRYESLSFGRDRFIWRWIWHLCHSRNPGFMLSCVPEQHRHRVAMVKLLLVMATTIIDDVADKLQDEALLNRLCQLSLANAAQYHPKKDGSVAVRLTADLLASANKLLEQAPNWDHAKDMLKFDLQQVWNSCHYGCLINKRPDLINHSENTSYGSHNMMVLVFGDIDLAFSNRGLDDGEMSKLREVFIHAQQMARIGNWVSTWEREITEKDLSSGVVSLGISEQVFTNNELVDDTDQHAPTWIGRARSAGIETKLFSAWAAHRDQALRLGQQVRNVDIDAYVDGFEMVMTYHLTSVGAK